MRLLLLEADTGFGRVDYTTDDIYEDVVVGSGTWTTFTVLNAPDTAFPLEDDAMYLQIQGSGEQEETFTFKVVNITPDTLELIYMERGGVLTFTKI